MKETLSSLLNIAVLVFAASSMLSVGFGHTLRRIIGPLRKAVHSPEENSRTISARF